MLIDALYIPTCPSLTVKNRNSSHLRASFSSISIMHFVFIFNLNIPVFVICKPTNMTHELILLFPVIILVGLMQFRTFVVGVEPQVPCYFIFGDSLVDSGNNNGLATAAKANYPPYGIDFPKGVSGRFTNGRTVADIIGMSLTLFVCLICSM